MVQSAPRTALGRYRDLADVLGYVTQTLEEQAFAATLRWRLAAHPHLRQAANTTWLPSARCYRHVMSDMQPC